ncbi:unknown [Prevotella sp. CAG:485]|nr:unknown [Prevotella sp. CAG:485]
MNVAHGAPGSSCHGAGEAAAATQVHAGEAQVADVGTGTGNAEQTGIHEAATVVGKALDGVVLAVEVSAPGMSLGAHRLKSVCETAPVDVAGQFVIGCVIGTVAAVDGFCQNGEIVCRSEFVGIGFGALAGEGRVVGFGPVDFIIGGDYGVEEESGGIVAGTAGGDGPGAEGVAAVGDCKGDVAFHVHLGFAVGSIFCRIAVEVAEHGVGEHLLRRNLCRAVGISAGIDYLAVEVAAKVIESQLAGIGLLDETVAGNCFILVGAFAGVSGVAHFPLRAVEVVEYGILLRTLEHEDAPSFHVDVAFAVHLTLYGVESVYETA